MNQPIFFSDVLVNTGANSNPKNNLSMATANTAMLTMCKEQITNGENPARIKNAYGLAVDMLNAQGFRFYKKELYNM